MKDRLRSLIALRSNKVFSGSVVNFASLGGQLVIQLASVPLLLAAFGPVNYGIWLLLSTIPVYFVMADLGLNTAATNDIALRSSEDRAGINVVFQSVLCVMVPTFVLLWLMVTIFVFATSGANSIWPEIVRPYLAVIPLLTFYAALYMIGTVPIAALRGTGHYARAQIMTDGAMHTESAAMLIVAVVSKNMVAAACAPGLVRLVATPFIYWEMRRLLPYVRLGWKDASRSEIMRLLRPALGNLALPAALSLSLQGTAMIVGAILGPAAVAIFVPVRTASRMAVQIAATVTRAVVPELATARGRNDRSAEQNYWRLMFRVRWLVLTPAAIGFALFGSWLVTVWSGGRIHAPPVFVMFMGVTILFHGWWYLNFLMLTASHEHVPVAKFVVGVCAVGLLMAGLLTPWFGLAGAALSVVLVDLALTAIMARFINLRDENRRLDSEPKIMADSRSFPLD